MIPQNNNILLVEPRLWTQALEQIRTAQKEGIKCAVVRPQIQDAPDIDIIPIAGLLLKTVPQDYRDRGLNATGYDEIAEAANKAAVSPKRAILLQVNSGGGMVDGIDIALDAIRAAAGKKTVIAYVDGLCASAAYWLASQADTIHATRFSEVGSIGAFSVMYDYSGMYGDAGIRAVVSRSGDQKGAGVIGDEITDRMKDVQDEAIAGIARMFINDVLASRPDVIPSEVSSGRTWLAEQAKDLKLIDGVVKSTRDITVSVKGIAAQEPQNKTMAEDDPMPQQEEDNRMSETNVQDAVQAERARVAAISTAFADDPVFAAKHITAGTSLEGAKAEYCDVMQARQKALATLEVPKPVKSTEAAVAAAPQSFMELALAKAAEVGIPVSKAAELVSRENRAAYCAYIGAKE